MKPADHSSEATELCTRAEAAFQKKTAQSPESLEALSPEATEQLLHELRVHQIELEMQNEELRRAQVELDVSRARYFDLYDLAPVGYLTLSESGLILQANLTAATLLGVTRADLVQQPLSRFIQKEDADGYYLLRKELLATGEARTCDLRLVKSGGTIFWAHLAATVNSDEIGAPILRLTLSNIEEREEYKRELQEKEERLSLATIHNGIGIWDWNLVTQKMIWDDSMFALYRIRREDFSGTEEAWRASLHPDDLERGDQEVKDAISGKRTFDTEFRVVWPNGEIRHIKAAAKIFRDENGTPLRMLGTNWDITDRKHAENALAASLDFATGLIRSMQHGFSVLAPNGVVLDANPALCEMTGFSREELIGLSPPFPYWPPEEYERIQGAMNTTLEGRATNFELIFMRRNGEQFPVFVSPFAVKNKEGEIISYSATVKDISERKATEEALRVANQKLRLHFEQTPMAVIEWDLDFRVTRWNPAAGTIFGYSSEEAVGRHASFIVPEAYRPHVAQVWQGLVNKFGGERSTNENVRQDGSTILCEWYNTPLIDENGTFTGAASVVNDITERRQTQQLLAWEKGALEMINSDTKLNEVLCGLMLGLENQLPGALCSILLLDDDGVHLRHGAAPSLPESYNRAIDGAVIGPKVGSCGTAAYAKRQVIVADIASDPLWTAYCELALSHGLQACWSTPILGRQKSILGTFAIYYREPRHPTPAELALVARAVHITRIAIERKQSESELRDSEEKFHALFENASDAIVITQGDLFIDCNARTLEMFGCHSRDQFLGHPPYEFSPPLQPDGRDSTELAIEKINAALNGQPQFFEWTHTKLDGTPFPAEVSVVKVEVGDKALLQGIVRDISERKRAEETIRRQNAELETRVEQRTIELSKANKELRGHMTARRQLEKEILEISEREQRRIGQDLHDDLGQQLAGIWCLSQLLESSLVTQQSPDATAATKITSRLKESLDLTRKLAQGLYPVALQAEGLSSALEELARRTTELFKVNCTCTCPQKLVLDYTVATHLYRIAQEAITNATKHGHAQNIEIELSSNSRQTYLTVNNDGIPLAKKMTNGDGMGLRIMKYRADMIGGILSIKSNDDHEGTSVTCMIHSPKK